MPAFVAFADAEALMSPVLPVDEADADADAAESGFEVGDALRLSGFPPGRATRCGRVMQAEDFVSQTSPRGRLQRWRYLGCNASSLAAAACLALLACAALAQSSRPAGLASSNSARHEAVRLDSDTSCSLFCFSVMRPNSTEQALVEYQIQRRASIFACDEYAVISTAEMVLSPGNGDVRTWYNPAPQVPIGNMGQPGVNTNSFLNTGIFITAFNTLVKSGRIFKHDFLIKVDPDAVFFPDRARVHLAPQKGQTLYFTNCDRFPEQGVPGARLFGSVEVFSASAMARYRDGATQCANRDWHGWGEDYYMQTCMMMLGVPDHFDYFMVGDSRCNFATCKDASRMAYHPFKDLPSYEACFRQAIGEIQ